MDSKDISPRTRSRLNTRRNHDIVTYKEEDFPSVQEAKEYGLSEEDFREYKNGFMGRRVPPQPLSDQELANQGYRSWAYCNLYMGLANT